MTTYATPGVYYQRVDASPPGIAALRTDIAGFVGIAPMGPPDTPVPVQSFRQFQATFGAFTGSGFLAYAVNAFFANGGTRCWVVRVVSPAAASASFVLSTPAPKTAPTWRVEASSPGVWGNDLNITVEETHRAQTVSVGSSPGAPQWTAVASVSGFSRAMLVRISQAGAKAPVYRYKVVSQVDATNGLLNWVAANPGDRLPYDAPLEGFAPNLPLLIESVEYTLLVWNLSRLARTYQGLSLVPEHPNYGPARLPVWVPVSDPTAPPAPQAAPEPVALRELRQVDALPLEGFGPIDVSTGFPAALVGGVDGLAQLSMYDFVGEDIDPLDDDITRARKQRGLRTLDLVDEVALLAIPDIQVRPIQPPVKVPLPPCVPDPCLPAPPPGPAPGRPPALGDLPPIFTDEQVYQVQAIMIARCAQLRDRFALLDPPFSAAQDDAAGAGAIRVWRTRFDSQFAALYYPWMRVVDPLLLNGAGAVGLTRDIPACGHVAGQIASTDLAQGPFKAPANAALAWVQDVSAAVNDPLHGVLNNEGINAIRTLAGRGIRIMGARTVSSDPDWRFVPVRRLMMMIEKAILVSTQWAVFEPNDVHTRSKLRLSLTSFLIELWRRGALAGDSPGAAFYVTCDATNNPPETIDLGHLLAEVGVALSQPFEFVVVRVGRVDNQFQVTEVATQ